MNTTGVNPTTCMQKASKLLHEKVTVFLTNGVKLSGSISEVVIDGLILTRDGVSQLIFSHAIATIMPQDGSHSLFEA